MSRFVKSLALLFSLFLLVTLKAQEQKKSGRELIKQAIENEKFAEADSIWIGQVNFFLVKGNFDTLVSYIGLKGNISKGLKGKDGASKALFDFAEVFRKNKVGPVQLIRVYREIAEYFEGEGRFKEAYDASKLALSEAKLIHDKTKEELATCEYNLGVYANYLGDVSRSKAHHREALQLRVNRKPGNAEQLYMSCNAMGGIMWYASKYDSAGFFFNKAIGYLKQTADNDLNAYYRPANVYNNLAAVYSAEGKTSQAIEAMRTTISYFQRFIASPEPHSKKASAREGVCQGIDNLAGFYREIGDYDKAGDLLRYSYKQKTSLFGTEHPNVFISEILLGQHYTSIRNYDSATYYLTKGLDKLEKAEGDYLFWAADGWYNLAMVNEHYGFISQAANCYAKSEALYEQSYQGSYDNIYMGFLRSASVFYAKNHDFSKAYTRAKKVQDYLKSIGEGQSLQGFYQLLNIAEIHYMTKRYKEAIRYSGEALNTVNSKIGEGRTALDSVKIEAFKPKAILIQSKAQYALRPKKDSVFLSGLSQKLDTALQILENQKVLIDDAESISILMEDHKELIDFAAKVALELYNISYGALYLEKFINLKESGVYSRIRSRLDMEQAIGFSGVPASVLQRERELKKALKTTLEGDSSTGNVIDNYLQASKSWNAYLDTIKTTHPLYYNLRYATLFKSLPQMRHSLPSQTTLVRYYFVDTSLVALVADKDKQRIIRLNGDSLESKVELFLAHNFSEERRLDMLYDLYQRVWSPLKSSISTEKLIIIPDGCLYSLGFDMLPFEPVSSCKQLINKSLLAKHAISYHYSIFMLEGQLRQKKINDNYIAFAPGFSDELKKKYTDVIKDSLDMDQGYLTLLPQPNTNSLTKKIRKLVGGEVYLETASTQSSFRKHAGNHKVIHIGTHAEYNNLHPEKSGLIFAKDGAENDSNHLYLSDIYNCDLTSDLTVLTACESGRPGYQDGEGMVSLAHAFNYAGSKNILTALWKIDEQSSSDITESFIRYTKDGLSTDEALRKSKLDYLQKSEGRLTDPGYWSGLVLMGAPLQVKFTEETNYSVWLAIIGGMLAFAALLFFSRQKVLQKSSLT